MAGTERGRHRARARREVHVDRWSLRGTIIAVSVALVAAAALITALVMSY